MELAMRGTIAPRTTQGTRKVREKAKEKAKERKAREIRATAVIQPAKAVGRIEIMIRKTVDPRVQQRTETKIERGRKGKGKGKKGKGKGKGKGNKGRSQSPAGGRPAKCNRWDKNECTHTTRANSTTLQIASSGSQDGVTMATTAVSVTSPI